MYTTATKSHAHVVSPDATQNEVNIQVEMLRNRIKSLGSALNGQLLTRKIYQMRKLGFVNDGVDTLDNYYVNYINSVLRAVRDNKRIWVFNWDQLAEVFRFEPDVQVTYSFNDEVFYLK